MVDFLVRVTAWLTDTCLLLVFSHGREREREREREHEQALVLWYLLQGHSAPHEGPILMTSPKPNNFPKAYLQIPSQWRLGLQHINSGKGRRHKIQFIVSRKASFEDVWIKVTIRVENPFENIQLNKKACAKIPIWEETWFTGSRRSNTYSSVVGRVIIWV